MFSPASFYHHLPRSMYKAKQNSARCRKESYQHAVKHNSAVSARCKDSRDTDSSMTYHTVPHSLLLVGTQDSWSLEEMEEMGPQNLL